MEDKIYSSQARFLQRVIVQSLANSLAGGKNWLADLLSGKITHDIFVIYGNQSIENFCVQVIIYQCKI